MEVTKAYILQHKRTKLYISRAPDSYHTKRITQARRFMDEEQIGVWMQASCYAPEDPEEYTAVPLKISYEVMDDGITGDHEEAAGAVPAGRHRV